MFLTAVMDAMGPPAPPADPGGPVSGVSKLLLWSSLKEVLAVTVELAKKLLDKLVDKLALCE